ncbi:MAG: F0F1 ATP synthase subunit delta [Thiobacillaceae bacterium]|nr:F0F1 ATP synthase subunit delta [Thiobacillaceae bacterium]MCX7672085.1 F0F1 ATP synthase subunit delta [Thiobacillaceae bacterium]MDW8322608.1 F0F1 ATP synthase subunit delta [Burkholderiales bacterium]
MAELTTVARPYAEAVARLARERGDWQAWSQRLAWLAAVVQEERLATIIADPQFSPQRLLDLLDSLCAERLGPEGMNLVRLLVDNKRLALAPEIARLFEQMRAQEEGRLKARIRTAYPLEPQQLAALLARLEARYGRSVEVEEEVDPELIGGVIIQVGDEVLDASVRGKLAELAASLTA